MYQIIHVHADAPLKPAVDEPCNGCGVCCLSEPCPVGVLISRKRRGACAALQWDDAQARYLCGLMAEPARFIAPTWLAQAVAPFTPRLIAAGKGCDADVTVGKVSPGS